MKRFIAVISMLLSQEIYACSVKVEQFAMENLMAAAAANRFNISFAKVTKMTFEDYDKLFIGMDPATTCPLQLQTRVKATINYSPSFFQRCSLSVNVTRLAQIFGEPEGPIETYEFATPASSCRWIGPTPLPVN